MACPTDELISRCAEKSLDPDEEGRVLGHVDECGGCREVLAGLLAALAEERLGRLETLRSPLEPDALSTRESDLPRPGTRVGRYQIEARLGAGGMGVVYRARDSELDRDVAIKLVRERSSEAIERLRREARSLARLEHPNVVSVHDAGSWRGYAFIVMQLFGGVDLRAWLELEPRAAEAILSVIVDASRGLDAAHQIDVIHRDIKPENIFVGDDGSAAVGDFGLAVTATQAQEGGAGTPVYMAPEVLAGGEATTRSDQFSLAVALFEALANRRPFASTSIDELAAAMASGPPPLPPALGVARRVRRAIARALSPSPEDRFADVTAFAAALRPPSRRPLIAIAAAIALCVAGGATVLASRADAPDSCRAAGDAVAHTWNADTAAELAARAVAQEKAHLAASTRLASERAASYAATLSDGYRDACRAHQRGLQSSELLDRRIMCLEQRRGDLGAIIAALADAEPGALERAPTALASLASPTDCTNTTLLLERVPLPTEPTARAAALALRDRVSAIDAALGLGDEPRALALLGDDVAAEAADAAKAPHPSARAGLLLAAAEAYQRNGKLDEAKALAESATLAAAEARDDEQLARAWLGLAGIVGYKMENPERGLEILQTAFVAVARAGSPAMLAGHHANLEGILRELLGEREEALALYRKAALLAEQAGGASHPKVALALDNVAGLLRGLGRFDEALAIEERILELRRELLGPEHPDLGRSEQALSRTHLALGHFEEAETLARAAVARMESSLGGTHPSVALAFNQLSHVLIDRGKLDEAEALDRRVVSITRATFGADHPRTIRALADLGTVLSTRGKTTEALATKLEALELGRKAFGADHPVVGKFENNVAIAFADVGKIDEAVAGFRRAIEIKTKALGADDADVGATQTNLAEVLCEHRRRREGLALLELALASAVRRGHEGTPSWRWTLATRAACLLDHNKPREALSDINRVLADASDGGDPLELGQHQEIRARALVATGAESAPIREAATAAIGHYLRAGERGKAPGDELRAWLARRAITTSP